MRLKILFIDDKSTLYPQFFLLFFDGNRCPIYLMWWWRKRQFFSPFWTSSPSNFLYVYSFCACSDVDLCNTQFYFSLFWHLSLHTLIITILSSYFLRLAIFHIFYFLNLMGKISKVKTFHENISLVIYVYFSISKYLTFLSLSYITSIKSWRIE